MKTRLALPDQLQPGDLARLARLAVLRSISMLVNVRIDLPDTALGNRLDEDITTLWDASEAFYESVSSSPLDGMSLARAQSFLVLVETAHRRVEASLGGFPAISIRAADDLRAFSRLQELIGSVMGSMESSLADAAGPVPPRPLSVDSWRRQAQLVANDLVALIARAGDAGRARPGRDPLMTELTDLLDRLQDFSRVLSIGPPLKEIQDSFRAARRQMWHVETRIIHLEWAVGLERPWRELRVRMNAISDEFGLPRVITMGPAARPLVGANRAVAAHVDHAVAWLDEFLADSGPGLRKTLAGSQFAADVTLLRSQLLKLRRSAIAGEAAARLSAPLQQIDQLNQQLSDRAAQLASQDANNTRVARYRQSAEAINKISGLLAKR